jgi:hypothetical protein
MPQKRLMKKARTYIRAGGRTIVLSSILPTANFENDETDAVSSKVRNCSRLAPIVWNGPLLHSDASHVSCLGCSVVPSKQRLWLHVAKL